MTFNDLAYHIMMPKAPTFEPAQDMTWQHACNMHSNLMSVLSCHVYQKPRSSGSSVEEQASTLSHRHRAFGDHSHIHTHTHSQPVVSFQEGLRRTTRSCQTSLTSFVPQSRTWARPLERPQPRPPLLSNPSGYSRIPG